jgi:hypothetical protein
MWQIPPSRAQLRTEKFIVHRTPYTLTPLHLYTYTEEFQERADSPRILTEYPLGHLSVRPTIAIVQVQSYSVLVGHEEVLSAVVPYWTLHAYNSNNPIIPIVIISLLLTFPIISVILIIALKLRQIAMAMAIAVGRLLLNVLHLICHLTWYKRTGDRETKKLRIVTVTVMNCQLRGLYVDGQSSGAIGRLGVIR